MEEQAENRLSEGVRDMNFEEAKKLLAEYGQEHILEGYDTLTEEQQENLLAQISNCDFSVLHHLEHRKEGEKRGRENEKRNVVKNLHKLNIPIEKIAKAVELSEKEVEEILSK